MCSSFSQVRVIRSTFISNCSCCNVVKPTNAKNKKKTQKRSWTLFEFSDFKTCSNSQISGLFEFSKFPKIGEFEQVHKSEKSHKRKNQIIRTSEKNSNKILPRFIAVNSSFFLIESFVAFISNVASSLIAFPLLFEGFISGSCSFFCTLIYCLLFNNFEKFNFFLQHQYNTAIKVESIAKCNH